MMQHSDSSIHDPSTGAEPPKGEMEELNVLESGGAKQMFGQSLSDSTATQPARNENPVKKSIFTKDYRAHAERKVVGLKKYGLTQSEALKRQQLASGQVPGLKSVEEMEEEARAQEVRNPFALLYLGMLAALRVMFYYLVTLDTFICCSLTVGLTLVWYYFFKDDENWNGGSLDFILLTFVVITPISAALGMAFTRRERALMLIGSFRGFAYHLYLAHCLWDWDDGKGRSGAVNVDWLSHCDAVLAQLIGIGDELSRFLSLPTTSRSRHRMTRRGRQEASKTIEAAYHLLESMSTQRMTRLMLYSERLKTIGLPSGEISRVRQYERFLSHFLEQLRVIKMYRTPQALRSFARIFTMLLPPFYAPAFAQVAIDTHSLAMGILNGLIVALALMGLFLALEVLEDPFTAFIALDGIDVSEEFEVLHFVQLVHTRELVFPDAPPYPVGRRTALMFAGTSQHSVAGRDGTQQPSVTIGRPPETSYGSLRHRHRPSDLTVPSVIGTGSITGVMFPDVALGDEGTGADDDAVSLYRDPDHAFMELGMPLEDDREHVLRESSFVIPYGGGGSVRSFKKSNHSRRPSSFKRMWMAAAQNEAQNEGQSPSVGSVVDLASVSTSERSNRRGKRSAHSTTH